MTLYTAGYRDPVDQKRMPPEEFYGGMPEEAVVVDIRSHPYSPFAPAYTGSGVEAAVREWKPGRKEFFHVRELGNTNKDSTGKRVPPPILVNPEVGYRRLQDILEDHGAAVIFCACSLATRNDPAHRCHRFDVAEEMSHRLPGLDIIHIPEMF